MQRSNVKLAKRFAPPVNAPSKSRPASAAPRPKAKPTAPQPNPKAPRLVARKPRKLVTSGAVTIHLSQVEDRRRPENLRDLFSITVAGRSIELDVSPSGRAAKVTVDGMTV